MIFRLYLVALCADWFLGGLLSWLAIERAAVQPMVTVAAVAGSYIVHFVYLWAVFRAAREVGLDGLRHALYNLLLFPIACFVTLFFIVRQRRRIVRGRCVRRVEQSGAVD